MKIKTLLPQGGLQRLIEFLFLPPNPNIHTIPDLHPFTLKFRNNHSFLEKDYLDYYYKNTLRKVQLSIIIAIVFYSIFSYLDLVFVPDIAKTFITIRLGIVVPFLLLALLLSNRKDFNQYMQQILFVVVLVAGGGIIAMILIGGIEVNSAYYAGIILVFIFTFTFVGIKFSWGVISTWLLVLSYEIVSYQMDLPYKNFISNNFFFISTLIFSMVAGYSIEYYRRSMFFSNYLLRVEKNKISMDNVELEKRVIKRTHELVKAKEEAEKADKLKSLFLAQMSHEIRTPINSMVSLAAMLREDLEGKLEDDHELSLDLINKAGNRIVRTVDLLLNLSELQAGTYKPIIKKFNLCTDVLSKLILEYKKITNEKNLKLYVNVETENTNLVADLYTVNQIFAQLMDNSLKYTDKGEIKINVSRDNYDNLIVEVEDTGVGIAKDYLPHLFEPFSQEEMGYTRKYDGNGIGLSLVKNYCKFNNARIDVKSKKNKGTTFKITFLKKVQSKVA